MTELNEQVKNQIDDVFARQQRYALELRKSDYKQRLAVLDRFEQAFRESEEKIYQSAADDFSKPQAEVDMSEIMAVLAELKHVRKNLKKWMKPVSVMPTASMIGTSSKIVKEPKGVTLVVSPWNYPFNLTFGPMIWSIAAGNTVIIKPSEMTPNMSAVIADIVERAFRPEEVSLFQGEADVASYLTALPFDHIFFTGSPAVGKHVMAAAAKNLTSVTLELGGKSPVIVDKSVNIKKAVQSIAWGKFSNNGQTCIAPDYLYVHESVKDQFVRELTACVEKQYGLGNNAKDNGDYCKVVNTSHYNRINRLLEDAKSQGGKLITGGQIDDAGRFIAPTLIEGMASDSAIMEEEIFGPLLPVITFSNIEEVIDVVNSKPKPLALYIYSTDKRNIDKVLCETSAGDTCVNQTMMHFLHHNLPFGGVNNSGIGKSGGVWGFNAFTHERSVLNDKFSSASMLHPPYTPKVRKLIKMAIKMTT
ncbi:MAG: aldehyde dehydrogenase family protein [Porticoccaceae bacterium]|nr:aldehyde dehydrogenase family protein [Porticoccaceae bacterium]MDA8879013.1 aldehyde dehydrogenase family protein [Porticoccaceae bacterium]MDB2394566.1 aldehyde dehydrogenase family protein [Porticoccaceae bacterium]MDB2559405.1 aldehyde dehydrogenase family protein [Porticoccaceae bacterium]MDG2145497.1 aldehyde dehydrogenase family protein [Porticoccaceae bacterium]